MIAELGRRIGEVETLVPLLHEHEGRVNGSLEHFDNRMRSLSEELRGRHEELQRAFLDHKHDLPAAPEPPHELAHAVDHPVETIDEALGNALPTPAAPEAPAEVEAPKALRKQHAYQSRLHRGR